MPDSEELLGVDILAGRVYRALVAEDGSLSLFRDYWLPGTVGAIVPVHDDDGWLLAAGRGFVHLAPDGSVLPLAEVAPVGTRMNDGVCDAGLPKHLLCLRRFRAQPAVRHDRHRGVE